MPEHDSIGVRFELNSEDGLILRLVGFGDDHRFGNLQQWVEEVGTAEFSEYYSGSTIVLGDFILNPEIEDEHNMTWTVSPVQG